MCADPGARLSGDGIVAQIERVAEEAGSTSAVAWPDLLDVVKIGQDALDVEDEQTAAKMQSMEIDQSVLRVMRELGSGEFGTVQLAELDTSSVRDTETAAWLEGQRQGREGRRTAWGAGGKLKVAVKSTREGLSAGEQAQFATEAKILVAFNHPHIVRVVGVCLRQSPNMLVLELMEGGDLKSYLQSHRDIAASPVCALLLACVTVTVADVPVCDDADLRRNVLPGVAVCDPPRPCRTVSSMCCE